jgi:hypothetical protein
VNELPIHELRRLISYNPKTGAMIWTQRMSNRVKPGMPALAAKKQSGHLHGFVRGVPLQAHRVAWALHYGAWPESFIDHINGRRDDNRITNLRVVDVRDNAKNRRPNSAKSSRLPHGVSMKGNGRYFAQIQEGGKNRHLGYFGTADAAKAAYDAARDALGFHKNHGAIIEALIAEAPE